MKKCLLFIAVILALIVCFRISPLFAQVQIGESSPFGALPAFVKNPTDPFFDAKNIGIKWMRLETGLFWAVVDPDKTGDPAKFRWKGTTPGPDGALTYFDYDAMLIAAQKSGLQILCNIDVQPGGDALYNSKQYLVSGTWRPINEPAYRNFVKAAVKRYWSVRYWQVGNEPDAINSVTDIGSFADLQRITYESVKEANPYAKVLIAGLTTGQGITSAIGIGKPNDRYYEKVLPRLKGRYVDIFDIHFYWGASQAGLVSMDGMTGIDYKDFKRVYIYYRNLLNQYGFYNVPIWIAEGGTFSGTIKMGTTFTQTETRQAQELVKGYVYPLSLGLERGFWAFGIVEGFGVWDNDIFDHTGLMYGGQDGVHKYGERKLAYYTYKLLTSKLEGSDWRNIKTLVATNGIYLFRFTRFGRPVWVAWNDNSSDRQVIVPGIMTPKIKVTEMVPKYNFGRGVPTTGEIFKVTTQAVRRGISAVLLKSNPVVIEESI